MIVVLNKQREHPFTVDEHRLREACPQIVDFVPTDALAGDEIDTLHQLLSDTVGGMEDVWTPMPRPWHRVKETLAATDESFLAYREYQSLCTELEVTEEREQESLATTLHRLGIALNFRDHKRLSQTSVLKPQWVTEGVYGLIRHTQKQKSHGVMPESWVAEALPEDKYPEEKHAFLLELMAKFEVAFPLAEQEDPDSAAPKQWLIPELLDENQPDAFERFRAGGVERFRYRYPEALPPGLLPRLIVRTHELSADHPEWRWHSGVVLRWGGAEALVRLSRSDRRTTVDVISDDPEERLRLVELIQTHLRELHGDVKAIEEIEMQGHPGSWVAASKLRKFERRGDPKETEEETEEGDLVPIPVSATLDRIESPASRVADSPSAPRRMRLFVSYAHDDTDAIKPLSKHLKLLGKRGYIQTWQDTQLLAGQDWKNRIFEEIDRADIVLFIYSTSSCGSDFIQKQEIPRALARAPDCRTLVASLDRNQWDKTSDVDQRLSKLQTTTWNNQPLLDFEKPHQGWRQVEEAIQKVVEELRKEHSR